MRLGFEQISAANGAESFVRIAADCWNYLLNMCEQPTINAVGGMELITADANYCNNFQFSILEVFPIKRDTHEVLEYEQLYKRKLWSKSFGLNYNI